MTIRDQEDVRETISDTVDARRKVQIMKKYISKIMSIDLRTYRWSRADGSGGDGGNAPVGAGRCGRAGKHP